MLNGDKGSVIDIVQSVSRCLRLHSEKDHGTLLVPCLVTEDALEGQGTFMKMRTFLSALGSVDSAIREEVIARAMNRKGGAHRIYTDMVIGSDEEVRGTLCEDFELRIFNSMGRSTNFSPEIRFELLREFCLKECRLPKAKEIYREFKIGIFLKKLLEKNHYTTTRDNWIQSLLSIESIRDSLCSRLDARNDEEACARRKISSVIRFEALVKFCKENTRLPLRSETYENIPVGAFINKLLSRTHYTATRDSWIQSLLSIESIKDEIQSHLDIRNDADASARRRIPPATRFEALVKFCKENTRLPLQKETHENIPVGQFICTLLSGKHYTATRDSWIQSMLSIESIRDEFQTRLDNQNDEDARAKRKISSAIRFEALVKFCRDNTRLPFQKEMYENIPVGQFMNNLLNGKYYADTRDLWIQSLLSIQEISEEFQTRLNARSWYSGTQEETDNENSPELSETEIDE
jgi:hypothetical protein